MNTDRLGTTPAKVRDGRQTVKVDSRAKALCSMKLTPSGSVSHSWLIRVDTRIAWPDYRKLLTLLVLTVLVSFVAI
jgi:hypothetical protein